MDKIQKLKQEKQYEQYVKEKTPRHNLFSEYVQSVFPRRADLPARTSYLSLF